MKIIIAFLLAMVWAIPTPPDAAAILRKVNQNMS
jgi:hypothetical protein